MIECVLAGRRPARHHRPGAPLGAPRGHHRLLRPAADEEKGPAANSPRPSNFSLLLLSSLLAHPQCWWAWVVNDHARACKFNPWIEKVKNKRNGTDKIDPYRQKPRMAWRAYIDVWNPRQKRGFPFPFPPPPFPPAPFPFLIIIRDECHRRRRSDRTLGASVARDEMDDRLQDVPPALAHVAARLLDLPLQDAVQLPADSDEKVHRLPRDPARRGRRCQGGRRTVRVSQTAF